MMKLANLSLAITAVCLFRLTVFPTTLWPLTHADAQEPAQKWKKDIERFVRADEAKPPRTGSVVFVGSSSIRRWKLEDSFPEERVVNRGFGGSQISDCLYFAEPLLLPHQPRAVVLYAGDNDLANGKSPTQVVADYQAFARWLQSHLPDTKLVFIAIKPSIKRWHLIDKIRETNAQIKALTERSPNQTFVALEPAMLAEDGRPLAEIFAKDGLHLNEAGYAIWTRLLRPHLARSGDDSWFQFRGPTGDGMHAGSLPLQWSEERHVLWKTAIPGRGWSSPVVVEDEVWLTTATPDGKQLSVLCVDAKSGKIKLDRKLFDVEEPREIHLTNSYASPTPLVEGSRVYVHYGSYGTACLERETGNTLWTRRDLPCHHWRGPGSSPFLHEDLLYIHYDGYDYQYIVALDKHNGKTRWKKDRNIDYQTDNGDLKKAYCTPILIEHQGRWQLISPAAKATIAYDPKTGEELWKLRYETHSATARPLWGNGMLYINSGFPKAVMYAVKPSGQGDITDTHVQWMVKKGIGSKPSAILIGERMYLVHDRGIAMCLNALTGEMVWEHRIGGKFSASPIAANGYLYFCDEEGKTTIMKATDEAIVVAENQLDDGCMASPAAIQDTLLLRSKTHLYRIGERQPSDAHP